MIPDILPDCVASSESYVDILDVPLFPTEVAALDARVVEKRRREFTTGRVCARRAMVNLQVPEQAIVVGENREPVWPGSIVGSITHCEGYRAAVVAHAQDVHTIGIDAELNQPLPSGVIDAIASSNERQNLNELSARHPATNWDRLLFSIKEATYKAWYPLMQRWLGFEDVDVTISSDEQRFSVCFLVNAPEAGGSRLCNFDGRYQVQESLLLTSIAVLTGAHTAT